jgi:hypothetical protein
MQINRATPHASSPVERTTGKVFYAPMMLVIPTAIGCDSRGIPKGAL